MNNEELIVDNFAGGGRMKQIEIAVNEEVQHSYWKEHQCSPKKKTLVLMVPQLDERYWGGVLQGMQSKDCGA